MERTEPNHSSLLPREPARPALFLDRDGVLNADTGYPHRVEDMALIEGASQALKYAKSRGFLLIVVTNQSGVARGLFSEDAVIKFNSYLDYQLGSGSKLIDAFYVCPFHPEATVARYKADHFDRKPHPGMLEMAIKDFHIDRKKSLMIGDKGSDIEAAKAAGVAGYLFCGGNLNNFLRPILNGMDYHKDTGKIHD